YDRCEPRRSRREQSKEKRNSSSADFIYARRAPLYARSRLLGGHDSLLLEGTLVRPNRRAPKIFKRTLPMTQSNDPHRKPNRLINEQSPYLRQHAYNPVDWYPWGDEALARAKAENKPIMLSIGYSACHWCHVMERESFENEDIAKLINQYFIPIKVDRE